MKSMIIAMTRHIAVQLIPATMSRVFMLPPPSVKWVFLANATIVN
jgi:hypothetical protein